MKPARNFSIRHFGILFLLISAGQLIASCGLFLNNPAQNTVIPDTANSITTGVQTMQPVLPTIQITPFTPTVAVQSTPTGADDSQVNPQVSGEIEIWHPYPKDSPEKAAMDLAAARTQEIHPNLNLIVLEVPASEILRDYQIDFLEGGGPDLLITTNSELGSLVQAGFVEPINFLSAEDIDQYIPQAIDGLKVDGNLYGLPKSYTTLMLFFRKSQVGTPPASTADLLTMIRDGKSFVSILSPYHFFPWSGAFGGRLFDEGMRCIADQGGWVESLDYLLELKNAGAYFTEDYLEAEELFVSGDYTISVNGSWELNKFNSVLGEDLGVAPLPPGPAGEPTPLIGVEGIFINPNSQNKEAAQAIAQYLSGTEILKIFADISGVLPARVDVATKNPYLQGLDLTNVNGAAIPSEEAFTKYWEPFGEMYLRVLSGEISPQDGVITACSAVNSANGN